jgi:hypothetical protein
MAGLLSPFLYSLPPISFFLDLVAMAALRRRMQMFGKIWHEMPLPPPLVIGFLSHFFFLLCLCSVFSTSAVGITCSGTYPLRGSKNGPV